MFLMKLYKNVGPFFVDQKKLTKTFVSLNCFNIEPTQLQMYSNKNNSNKLFQNKLFSNKLCPNKVLQNKTQNDSFCFVLNCEKRGENQVVQTSNFKFQETRNGEDKEKKLTKSFLSTFFLGFFLPKCSSEIFCTFLILLRNNFFCY